MAQVLVATKKTNVIRILNAVYGILYRWLSDVGDDFTSLGPWTMERWNVDWGPGGWEEILIQTTKPFTKKNLT